MARQASTAQQEKRAEVDRSDVAADVVEVLSFLQFQPRDIILDTERNGTMRGRSEQRVSSGYVRLT